MALMENFQQSITAQAIKGTFNTMQSAGKISLRVKQNCVQLKNFVNSLTTLTAQPLIVYYSINAVYIFS